MTNTTRPAEEDGGNGWTGWACQYPGKLPRLYGAREIAELNFHPDEGDRLFQVREVAPGAAAASSERQDALCDAAYVAGVQAGFNAAASTDPMALSKLLESRARYLRILKRTRAAQAQGGKA